MRLSNTPEIANHARGDEPRLVRAALAGLLIVAGCTAGDEPSAPPVPVWVDPPAARVEALPPIPTPAPKRPAAPPRVRNKPAAPSVQPSDEVDATGDPDAVAPVADGMSEEVETAQPEVQPAPELRPASLPLQLRGMSEAQATALLGRPSAVEDKAPARIWTYRSETCTVRVAFFPQVETLDYRVLSVDASEKGGEVARARCYEDILGTSRERGT